MPPLVAIVILNWNGKRFLEQFLPSVLNTTYANHKVVVADNASSDDSLPFLEQHYPQVEIIRLSENFGFAKGYNEALKRVEADYYMLLNSDVEITPGWLEPMVNLLEQKEEHAACQPKILAYHNKRLFEYAGAAGGWMDALGYPFARGRVFDVCEEDQGQYDNTTEVFWATGAAMLIKSKAFHGQSGFDAFFFAHMEEIDLCWRLQLAGYKLFCCPDSVVYHVGGGTLPQGNSRKTFLNFRNNLIMLSKNMAWSEKWWKIPVRLVLDGIAAIRALAGGDTGFFKAVWRAHFAFYGWLLFQDRASNRQRGKKQKLKQLKGVYNKLIIWSFFIKKKKKFSEIIF